MHDGSGFVLTVGSEQMRTRNIAIGVGLKRYLPAGRTASIRRGAFTPTGRQHSSQACRMDGLRRAGVGQSGANIVQYLLSLETLPSVLPWISRCHSFEPLNDPPLQSSVLARIRRRHLAPR